MRVVFSDCFFFHDTREEPFHPVLAARLLGHALPGAQHFLRHRERRPCSADRTHTGRQTGKLHKKNSITTYGQGHSPGMGNFFSLVGQEQKNGEIW